MIESDSVSYCQGYGRERERLGYGNYGNKSVKRR